MAISYELFDSDGVNRNFAVNFNYLDRDHVFVAVDGVNVPFTFLSDALVQLAAAPAAGTNNVRVYRESARDGILVEWNIAYIPKEDLDNGYLHPLYVAQEAFDRADESIGLAGDNTWDAQNHPIKNVTSGEGPQDAVTKAQLDAAVIGAGQVPTPANPADDGKVLAASGGVWVWTAITALAFRALAFLGIGEGLEDDGANGLRVKLNGTTLTRDGDGLKVTDGGVGTLQLADDAVATPKIPDDAVTTPKILDGAVTLPKYQRGEFSAASPPTNTLTSSNVEQVELDLGTVSAGDRILLSARLISTKGGTAGRTVYTVDQKSGAATIEAYHDQVNLLYSAHHMNGTLGFMPSFCVFKVLTGGTLVMRLRALSEGSNATNASSQLHAMILRGA